MNAAKLSFYLLLPLVLPAQTLRTDPGLAKLTQEIRAEVSGNEALDFVVRLHEKDRWANFAKFQESARYLQTAMREIGLSKVEVLSAPADGVTQFGFWTMPLAWDVKQARLEVIEPAAPPICACLPITARNRRRSSCGAAPPRPAAWIAPMSWNSGRQSGATEKRRCEGQDGAGGGAFGSGRTRRAQSRALQDGRRGDDQRCDREPRPDKRPLLGECLGRPRLGVHQNQQPSGGLLDHAPAGAPTCGTCLPAA